MHLKLLSSNLLLKPRLSRIYRSRILLNLALTKSQLHHHTLLHLWPMQIKLQVIVLLCQYTLKPVKFFQIRGSLSLRWPNIKVLSIDKRLHFFCVDLSCPLNPRTFEDLCILRNYSGRLLFSLLTLLVHLVRFQLEYFYTKFLKTAYLRSAVSSLALNLDRSDLRVNFDFLKALVEIVIVL